MRVRLALLAVLVAGLFASATTEAKLIPKLDKRAAAPGETVGVDFGRGVEHYLAPLEVYLVRTGAEPKVTGRDDPRLSLVGWLGTRGWTISKSRLTFRVPSLPSGRYTLAVFFRGTATGRWHNLTEGLFRDASFRDRLVIRIVRRQ
jgi:hypothetical protein